MHRDPSTERVVLSATDLANFLACRRKTALDYSVVRGERKRPELDDDLIDVLRLRGKEHETRFVQKERDAGLEIVDLTSRDEQDKPRPGLETREKCVAGTLAAMRCGARRIVQAALQSKDGNWFGYADVLRRVEKPSVLGDWSYEALDTKLAQETKGATVLQLSLYSDMLAEIQGVAPEYFWVVTPSKEEQYRVSDFGAYYRLVKRNLLATSAELEGGAAELPYPEPVAHCQICDWRVGCTRQLRDDDHLSFVANCSRTQRDELKAWEITTLAVLGHDGLPTGFKPSRGSLATYERLQHQARLQLQARETKASVFEALPIEPAVGLCLLPEPSAGDVFLDLEGAAWARPSTTPGQGGREYLIGLVTIDANGQPIYEHFKAYDDGEERAAFEAVIDRLIAAFDAHPDMHVYHFAPYEPTALKKLMGRYATRGPELDRLLRAERFVDLYAIARHAIRAGVESYSIKELEQFYGYTRAVTLEEAGKNRRLLEHALDMDSPQQITDAQFEIVRGYNCDDCVSTWRLREWLEKLRQEAIDRGTDVPRSVKVVEEKKPGELEARARELREKLLAQKTDAARVLLSYTLDWHTREMKASWWEYYRLRDLPPEDQADEPMVIVGLQFLETVGVKQNKKTGKPTGTVIDRYSYAADQELEIGEGDGLTLVDETDWGTVVAIDRVAKTIDVKKGPKSAALHPPAAFSFFNVGTDIIQESVLDFGDDVLANGLTPATDCRRALLLRERPRLSGEFFPSVVVPVVPVVPVGPVVPAEDAGDFAVRIAPQLDRTVLAIQGPPGTGKSYTGARMICALVAAGKKVGVAANSHKVIRNLLKGVRNEAKKTGQAVRIGHRGGDEPEDAGIQEIDVSTEKAVALLQGNVLDVLGGVAWTWASDKAQAAVDVLFVDEAGQMSLANVLGSARAAESLVLLGDQQQLSQPSKAAHPDGVSVSALEHVLAGERTMPAGRGIFLPRTRRLAPEIAAFTSEVFYEGRLDGLPELANQRLANLPPFEAGALWTIPVEHSGNQSYSLEEAEVIGSLIERLTTQGRWIDRDGHDHPLTLEDVLVVAPYNAQIARLSERLPAAARVGTVDKFQGQEAPVVVYSMTTSRPEDAPRGMEFLYSLNRLNVATSRAQCAVIVVANPALFEPGCSTPRQMQLAGGVGRYGELAKRVRAMLNP